MSMETKTAIAENRTVFDDRAIREEDLELSESGDYALYVAERVGMRSDEVHVFSTSNRGQDYGPVWEAIQTLTDDADHLISNVTYHRGTDERQIFEVSDSQTPEEFSSGQILTDYISSRI